MNEKQQRNDQRKPLVEPLDKLIPLSEENNELISIFVASHHNLSGNPKKAIIPSFPFCPSSLLARYSVFHLHGARTVLAENTEQLIHNAAQKSRKKRKLQPFVARMLGGHSVWPSP